MAVNHVLTQIPANANIIEVSPKSDVFKKFNKYSHITPIDPYNQLIGIGEIDDRYSYPIDA